MRPFLIAFYRSIARHPLYAALNILGLAFGIAVFIIISLQVHHEATFDRWVADADRIYEVGTSRLDEGQRRPTFGSAGLTLDAIRAAMPEARGTRVVKTYSIFRAGGEPVEEEEYLVDDNFLEIFPLELIAGRRSDALQPDTIVISQSMAQKYFGETDVVGRTLTLRDLIGGVVHVQDGASEPHTYRVSAVFRDAPGNSSLNLRFLRLMTPQRVAMFRNWDNWEVRVHRTFFYFETPGEALLFNKRVDAIVDSQGRSPFVDAQFPGRPRHESLRVRVAPLVAEHLDDEKSLATVLALGTLGGLALIVALVNYINLATARSIIRAREVALRRTTGATVQALRLQFLGEALLHCIAALVLGFSLLELSLPLINQVGGTRLHLNYTGQWRLVTGLVASVLAFGALAGLYPAVVMAGYQPAEVFASTRSPSGGRLALRLREGLVLFQFTLVTVFLIVVVGFGAQLKHMQTSALGFDRQGLLMTNALINSTLTPGQVSAIKAQWVVLPNVVTLTSGMTPGPYFSQSTYTVTPAAKRDPSISAALVLVDDDYFETYATPVLAGRTLGLSDQEGDSIMAPFGHVTAVINVVVNRSGSEAFGYASPELALGQTLQLEKVRMTIVGVVADQRLDAPEREIRPAIYFSLNQMTYRQPTVLRYSGVSQDVMKARLRSVWKRLAPDTPLDLMSGEEALNTYYEADRRLTHLFAVGAALVGGVGVLGLYGMAAFTTSARTVEIGLRKAMGASCITITGMLVLQFLRPVILANVVAWPVAYLVLDLWLKRFDDRVAMSPWFFASASSVSLLVAVATVAALALRAATMTPARALRHE